MALTTKEVAGLLRASGLPGKIDFNLLMRISTVNERKEIIVSSSASKEEKQAAAAVEIQRWWRGHLARCILISPTEFGERIISTSQDRSTQSIYQSNKVEERRQSSSRDIISQTETETTYNSSNSSFNAIEASYNKYVNSSHQHIENLSDSSLDILSFREFCATFIQNWWRKCCQERNILSDQSQMTNITIQSDQSQSTSISLSYSSPATAIPSLKSEVLSVRMSRPQRHIADENEAVNVIQRAWRCHMDISIFKYYKELINYRLKGNPNAVLKSINPKESHLLDMASGSFLKFRLNGLTFPPVICYKIFTHRNVADIGSFAPRDYTDLTSKQEPAIAIHNHITNQHNTEIDSPVIAYNHQENNGWRSIEINDKFTPLKAQLMNVRQARYHELSPQKVHRKTDVDIDEHILMQKPKFPSYHHYSKLVRIQDVKKRKRQKKIQWLKKIYQDGMMTSGDDDVTTTIVKSVASGMIQLINERGEDHVEESEVDELLNWTAGLDYEGYIGDWKQIGTSYCYSQMPTECGKG